METQELLRPVAKVAGKVKTLGIVVLLLGIVALLAPNFTGMSISVLVGFILLLSGIGRTLFAWLSLGWGSTLLKAFMGIITCLAGGYMIFNPDQGARALAIVLTFYLFVDGIGAMVFAARLPPVAGGAWMMVGALASVLAGIFMWMQWPASGDLAVGLLIGIKLCIDGIELIGIGKTAEELAGS
ncbi:DUF308 domain-containing protein [Thalassotalea sp. LPB0316]|uniref:HdeD family acid-resistance protein n=1 Tax=Thalassotalea sp. LPB0316 TaxID=2769490 RepID=UPI001868991E|nr:DUF308 domain-containing protein [Thalassotalea sp. LPB0316]QOL25404.1 DUF308 domain-containing protein [Thalassotalea sp. LPB0316]